MKILPRNAIVETHPARRTVYDVPPSVRKAYDQGTRATLVLPYPPSINHYFAVVRGRKILSKRGREYRAHVEFAVPKTWDTMTGRLRVHLVAYMPDHRLRDIDNLQKPLIDALTHAGIWHDDGQIDDLRITRGNVDRERPRVEVEIIEVGA